MSSTRRKPSALVNNVHVLPELLTEVDLFCNYTDGAPNNYDVYNPSKVANEAIALWLQTEGVQVLHRITRLSHVEIQTPAAPVEKGSVIEWPAALPPNGTTL